MYCNHCGAELLDSAAFCMKCGTRLTHPTTEPAMSPQGPARAKYAVRLSRAGGAKAIKIGIAVGLLVFVVLAFWPTGYAGRFTPHAGTNFALDNKTGKSCRMSGEKTPTGSDEWMRKYRTSPELPPGYKYDPANPVLL